MVVFGPSDTRFATFGASVTTSCELLVGEVVDLTNDLGRVSSPPFAALWVWSFVFVVVFILISVLLAIIVEAYLEVPPAWCLCLCQCG